MTELLQAVVLGLLIGGVYALMASGLTLMFGVMNIINVAQGAFLILVAMITWWLWSTPASTRSSRRSSLTPMMFGFGWLLYRTWSRGSAAQSRVDVGAADVRASR